MEISHFEKDLKSHLMVNDLVFNINYKQINKPKAWVFWQNCVLRTPPIQVFSLKYWIQLLVLPKSCPHISPSFKSTLFSKAMHLASRWSLAFCSSNLGQKTWYSWKISLCGAWPEVLDGVQGWPLLQESLERIPRTPETSQMRTACNWTWLGH